MITESKSEAGNFVLFLVTDYVPLTLFDIISNCQSLQYSEEHVRKLMYNSLCCLRYLHQAGIMHRDIKPSNLLVDEHLNVKLCDFGFARGIPDCVRQIEQIISEGGDSGTIEKRLLDSKPLRKNQERRLSKHVITRYYRPPEIILLEKSYSTPVDIWGLGCIFAELLANLETGR